MSVRGCLLAVHGQRYGLSVPACRRAASLDGRQQPCLPVNPAVPFQSPDRPLCPGLPRGCDDQIVQVLALGDDLGATRTAHLRESRRRGIARHLQLHKLGKNLGPVRRLARRQRLVTGRIRKLVEAHQETDWVRAPLAAHGCGLRCEQRPRGATKHRRPYPDVATQPVLTCRPLRGRWPEGQRQDEVSDNRGRDAKVVIGGRDALIVKLLHLSKGELLDRLDDLGGLERVPLRTVDNRCLVDPIGHSELAGRSVAALAHLGRWWHICRYLGACRRCTWGRGLGQSPRTGVARARPTRGGDENCD